MRPTKTTVLFFGEGRHDAAFLIHIKNMYNTRSSQKNITIKPGRGGCPEDTLIEAMRVYGQYDARFVKLDHDKHPGEIKLAVERATENNTGIVFTKPCLDWLLLEILEPGRYTKNQRSSTLKRAFETHYLNRKQRIIPQKYERHYPISVLEEARQRLPELDAIIKVIADDIT